MPRKKWTTQTEITESLLKFREKRKWQIALRRYVLEQNRCFYYAPFFGIDITNFRQWIDNQFDEDTNWENFSDSWQFDHIIPVTYFDFKEENDLKLCWNFTNIRIEKLQLNKNRGNRIDLLGAKSYFESLYENTGYLVCQKMLEKIVRIELSQRASNEKMESFVKERKPILDIMSTFSAYEYDKLNSGNSIEEVLNEREFIKKFSSK